MRRGFKAEAERRANALREALSLSVSSPLMGIQLSTYLEVKVSPADRIPRIPAEVQEQLWSVDTEGWSAFTVSHETRGRFIFYNTTHSRGRHESNVMHEVSHLICEHPPSKFVRFDNCDFSLRTCRPEEEKEADWLSGCLKLPRDSIVWAVRRGMTDQEIATHFVTSLKMAEMRRNVTGVDRQLRRGRNAR